MREISVKLLIVCQIFGSLIAGLAMLKGGANWWEITGIIILTNIFWPLSLARANMRLRRKNASSQK